MPGHELRETVLPHSSVLMKLYSVYSMGWPECMLGSFAKAL